MLKEPDLNRPTFRWLTFREEVIFLDFGFVRFPLLEQSHIEQVVDEIKYVAISVRQGFLQCGERNHYLQT